MPTIQPSLNSKLRAELERADAFHEFVMQTFPHTFTPQNDRVNLLAAKTHLADDLYGSILCLFTAGGGYDGGAFALVEATVEAQWQFFCASDKTFKTSLCW